MPTTAILETRRDAVVPKILLQLLTALAAAIIAMVGFWLLYGRGLTTTHEVRALIQETAPYVQDRQAINLRLDAANSINAELKTAIQNNTKAITSLQTTIAVLAERISPRQESRQ